jgi:hypothetical protein
MLPVIGLGGESVIVDVNLLFHIVNAHTVRKGNLSLTNGQKLIQVCGLRFLNWLRHFITLELDGFKDFFKCCGVANLKYLFVGLNASNQESSVS